jgi:hypothetical protein
LSPDLLLVTSGDGRTRRVELEACEHRLADATLFGRFVRHLRVDGGKRSAQSSERFDLATPPELGCIAPRAARLPILDEDVEVVEVWVWDTVVEWLGRDCRLSGCTIDELSLLARIASPAYAVEIGERAAHLAGHLSHNGGFLGPMRGTGGLDSHRLLRPLEKAARESTHAAEAYMAAMARVALLV